MANGTVGVQNAATGQISFVDNTELPVGGKTVERQRVDPIPSRASTYYAGSAATAVSIPSTMEIVAVACHSTGTTSTVTIAGGPAIPVPPGTQFSDSMTDAPIPGVGANSVVFTGAGVDSYYVRVRPIVT